MAFGYGNAWIHSRWILIKNEVVHAVIIRQPLGGFPRKLPKSPYFNKSFVLFYSQHFSVSLIYSRLYYIYTYIPINHINSDCYFRPMAKKCLPIYCNSLIENNVEDTQKYECPSCTYLLRDAVQTFCGHWLCQPCAVELFKETSPRCPRKDCNELWIDDGEQPVKLIRKFLMKFCL